MTVGLEKQRFLAGTPAHLPPVVAATERVLVPEGLLDGDELVLLAVKPSLWFIILRSGPWLAICTLIGALSWYLAYQDIETEISRLGLQLSIIVALLRLSLAMFQWASRLYVLTNRRVMRIKGVLRIDVFECPLHKIQNTYLSLTLTERILRVGTIHICTASPLGAVARWEQVAQPLVVHTRLRNAIARSRGGNCGEL